MRAISKSLTFCFLFVAFSFSAEAQHNIPRVGYIGPVSSLNGGRYLEAFRRGLHELGYIEGKNIGIEVRWTEAKRDRLTELAAEMVRLKADVIVTSTTPAVLAAKKSTRTIPIVFAGAGDPVGAGLVSSLAHPGENVTGLSILSPELDGKRLELLKETFGRITRVAYLWDPSGSATGLPGARATAPALGLQLLPVEVQNDGGIDLALEAVLRERAQAITMAPIPIINVNRRRIIDFAAKNRLPAIYPYSDFIDAGGLMFYGVNITDLYRRAATYVDKILKGAKPADLPVEQPTKFELVINLKTAKQIGLTIPPNVLARADRVIK
jgi:putative ABC transport system substrate-binding protein